MSEMRALYLSIAQEPELSDEITSGKPVQVSFVPESSCCGISLRGVDLENVSGLLRVFF